MKTVVLAVIGILVGIPLSYYFQPSIVQAKVTLPEYLKHVPEILQDQSGDYILPFLLSIGICGLIGGVLGWFMDQATDRARERVAQ